MLIIKRYKRQLSGKAFWEYKIFYKDPFTKKIKTKRKKGFASKKEAQTAANEMLRFLKQISPQI